MVYEDFTTYTEVDPNNHITVASATHVDFICYKTEDARLYKDYGINHFGDFEHKIDVRLVSATGNSVNLWCHALTNELDDLKGLCDAKKTFVSCLRYQTTTEGRIFLWESYNGINYTQYYVLSGGGLNVWYYLTIKKSGTSLTCKIYSDSARTNLLATLSLTLQANHKFRYLHVCQTWNDGDASVGTDDIENLDLQEAAVGIASKRLLVGVGL